MIARDGPQFPNYRSLTGSGGRDHVLERKACYPFVVLGQRSKFVLADVAFEILEGPVADEFFDLGIDEVRRKFAIGSHHIGRRRDARCLIRLERGPRIAMTEQSIRKCAGINQRLDRKSVV